MNFIEISLVVIEIPVVEYDKLAVPVNNTLVYHMAFLATDTRPCVLMLSEWNMMVLVYVCMVKYQGGSRMDKRSSRWTYTALLSSTDLCTHLNMP